MKSLQDLLLLFVFDKRILYADASIMLNSNLKKYFGNIQVSMNLNPLKSWKLLFEVVDELAK